MSQFYHSLKFYGTAPNGHTGLFKFKVNNRSDALAAIKRFQSRKWTITAAYLDTTLKGRVRYSNEQIYSAKYSQ